MLQDEDDYDDDTYDQDIKFLPQGCGIRYKVDMIGKYVSRNGGYKIEGNWKLHGEEGGNFLPFCISHAGIAVTSEEYRHPCFIGHNGIPGGSLQRNPKATFPAMWGFGKAIPLPQTLSEKQQVQELSVVPPSGRWSGYFDLHSIKNQDLDRRRAYPSKVLCHESCFITFASNNKENDLSSVDTNTNNETEKVPTGFVSIRGSGSNQFGAFIIVGTYNIEKQDVNIRKIYTRVKHIKTKENRLDDGYERRSSVREKKTSSLLKFKDNWDDDYSVGHSDYGDKEDSPSAAYSRKRERSNTGESSFRPRKKVRSSNSISDVYSLSADLNDFDYDYSFDPSIPRCHVCDTSKPNLGNSLLVCGRCSVHVHQSCYGVVDVPIAENWYCKPCLSMQAVSTSGLTSSPTTPSIILKGKMDNPQCILCVTPGGAMKQTQEGTWVHVICAMFIPEVLFLDEVAMEPVGSTKDNTEVLTNLSGIPRERYGIVCSVCNKNIGISLRCCDVSGCHLSVHVLCAREKGLHMSIIPNSETLKGYYYRIMCALHSNLSVLETDLTSVDMKEEVASVTLEPYASVSSYTFTPKVMGMTEEGLEIVNEFIDTTTGDAYEGEMKDGLKHGKGCLIYSNGVMYEGSFRRGVEHGYGVVSDDTDRIVYEGEMMNGKFHGTGKYYFSNGDIYEGDWREGSRVGKGVYTFVNKSKYVGEWKNHLRHGRGEFTHHKGHKYVGDWKMDERDGKGVLTLANQTVFDGYFKYGLLEGKGLAIYEDGSRYEGMWKLGKKEGRGTLSFINGATYNGHFKDDTTEGTLGTFTLAEAISSTTGDFMIPIILRDSISEVHRKAGFTERGFLF